VSLNFPNKISSHFLVEEENSSEEQDAEEELSPRPAKRNIKKHSPSREKQKEKKDTLLPEID